MEVPVQVIRSAPLALVPTGPTIDKLVDQFFEGRNQRTLEAYQHDLSDFAAFLGEGVTTRAACWQLVGQGAGAAHSLVLDYRNRLADQGRAPATVNRRLAALRAIVKHAATVELIDARGQAVNWKLQVKGLKNETYRDTAGPARPLFQQLLAAAAAQKNPAIAARDTVILRLLHDRGLRRGEVCGMDYADLELDNERVKILGKGKTQKEWVTLPPKACAAMKEWLKHRDPDAVPLLHSLDHKGSGDRRLPGTSVNRLMARLSEKIGLPEGAHVKPHGLRHASITQLLHLTNGNVRDVQKFSRHVNVNTLLIYDDAKDDVGGELAAQVEA